MNLNLLIRRRGTPADQPHDPAAAAGEGTTEEPGLKPQWTGASAAITKALTVGLWCLVAAGPLALGLHLMTPAAPAPVVQAQATDTAASERAAVGAFAQEFVTTWLTTPSGRETDLENFVVDASNATLPERPWMASEAATSRIVAVSDQLWSVTVAVTVTDPAADPAADPVTDKPDTEPSETEQPATVRRYFQVPVRYADGALRAQTLPAPVAGPHIADPVPLNYRYRVASTEPVATAAGEFLTALLTGASDVARYVSPGASIASVTPPPYVSVEVEDVMVDEELPVDGGVPTTGEQRHLLVTAAATAGQTQTVAIQYALTMTARDGRWEVEAIDPTPVVSTDLAADSASPPASPSGQPSESPAPSEPVTTPSTTN